MLTALFLAGSLLIFWFTQRKIQRHARSLNPIWGSTYVDSTWNAYVFILGLMNLAQLFFWWGGVLDDELSFWGLVVSAGLACGAWMMALDSGRKTPF